MGISKTRANNLVKDWMESPVEATQSPACQEEQGICCRRRWSYSKLSSSCRRSCGKDYSKMNAVANTQGDVIVFNHNTVRTYCVENVGKVTEAFLTVLSF